jgi:hypothetical protein
MSHQHQGATEFSFSLITKQASIIPDSRYTLKKTVKIQRIFDLSSFAVLFQRTQFYGCNAVTKTRFPDALLGFSFLRH